MRRVPATDWQGEYLTRAALLAFEQSTSVWCSGIEKAVVPDDATLAAAFDPSIPGTISMTRGESTCHVYPMSAFDRRSYGGLLLTFDMQ